MQTATTTAQTSPTPVIFARHLIGMMIVALANPLIYYDSQPIGMWLITWAAPFVLALVVYGIYAGVMSERAKRAWPNSFFMLAWVLLGLLLIGQWSSKPSTSEASYQASIPAAVNTQRTPSVQPQQGSQIDEILKDAPAYQPAR